MKIQITNEMIEKIEYALNHNKTVEIKIEHSNPVIIEINRKVMPIANGQRGSKETNGA
jgi:hypothetical protein